MLRKSIWNILNSNNINSTEPVKPGQKAEIEFIADKDFIVESYWPLSNVKKAELKVVVK
jgi:hypothetical protein